MNVISARPPADILLERFKRLAPGPKLLLRLKSLVFSQTNKSEFVDCLKATGLRTPDRKAWTHAAANAVLDTLVSQDLLVAEILICPPSLLHLVAVDAAASQDAAALAAAVRRTFPARRDIPQRRWWLRYKQ